jgi:hypothetical protein
VKERERAEEKERKYIKDYIIRRNKIPIQRRMKKGLKERTQVGNMHGKRKGFKEK